MIPNRPRKQHDEATFDIFDDESDGSSPAGHPPSSRPVSHPQPPGYGKANRKPEQGEARKE